MFGRGVALGLGGGLNLADLTKGKRLSSGAVQQYYRQQQSTRRSSAAVTTNSTVSRPSPSRQQVKLTQILDTESDDMDKGSDHEVRKSIDKGGEHQKKKSMAPKRPPPPKKKQPEQRTISQQRELEEQAKRLVVKRALNRKTFWQACRALVVGSILLFGGTAMCTVSFYNDYFAMETVMLPDNITITTPNPTTKFQFQSMKYIGAIIMGTGAFVLMMACVTTLEGRDRQARLYQEQLDAAEKAPLSRRGTMTKKHSATLAAPPLPGPSVLKSSTPTGNLPSSDSIKKDLSKISTNNNTSSYQTADLMAVPSGNGGATQNNTVVASGGVVNRCFIRDDSKTASKPDTDSGPSGTTTTTLTWSKNGGPPRCEMDVVCKYPSTSAIDSLIRKPDERALLQRFLEDQSRLVEDRLQKRIQQQHSQNGPDEGFRSVSLDATTTNKVITPCNKNFRSEEIRKNVVAAEVHHASDASPQVKRIVDVESGDQHQSADHMQVPTTSAQVYVESETRGTLKAPVIAPDTFELFSPMSVSPDTPGSVTQKQASKSPVPTSGRPSRMCTPSESPCGGSISGSYVTVVEAGEDDFMNANRASSTPVQRSYNTFAYLPALSEWPPLSSAGIATGQQGSEPGQRKLYDSVFLAENLRRRASSQQDSSMFKRPAQKLLSMDYEPFGSLVFRGYEERRRSQAASEQQTGLQKDWKEMNANYLTRHQPKL